MTLPQPESPDPPAAPSPSGQAVPGYGAIVRFAVPIMAGMMTQALLAVVDAAFVGRLGTAHLAALGMASVYYFTWFVLFVGLMRNSIAFLARAQGAGQPERMGEILGQYQLLALLALPVSVGLALVFPLLLRLAGIEPEVTRLAVLYLNIRIWDIPFALTLILYASLYQSLGNSLFPAAVQLSAVLLNGVLDYGLIFGAWGLPALGMAGSALATVIAHVTACGFLLVWVHARPLRRRCRLRWFVRPNRPLMREVLEIGVPQGVGDFVEVLGFTGFFFIVGVLGQAALAANNIGVQATHLLFMPGYAVGIAASSYMGRLIGAGAPDAALTTVRRTLLIGVTYMALMGIPLWFFGEAIARVFTTDPEVVVLAGLVFKVMALYQPFDALGMICRGALSGAGDTLVPTLMMGGIALTVFYPTAIWLSRTLEPGVMGAWLGAMAHLIVLGLAMKWRLDHGAWRRIRIDLAPEA